MPILPLNHSLTRQETKIRFSTRFSFLALVFSISFIALFVRFGLIDAFVIRPDDLDFMRSEKVVSRPFPVTTPSWNEIDRISRHSGYKPLVISGPSGVGKGTLISKLVEFYNHDEISKQELHDDHQPLGFSVSHTTRKARPGEIDGIHYHFIKKDEMLKDIRENKFIEHAEVHGNLYGTSYDSVQRVINAGKICILDIDINGAKKIKENTSIKSPYFVFVAPPSMKILEQRLRDRKTETEDAIQRRTANAQKEVDFGTAHGNFDEVLINNNLDHASLRLRQILEEWYPHLNQIPASDLEL